MAGRILGAIAIFVALAGTAVALPGKNTVDSGDIKNERVKGKDVADGSITSSDVADNSLTGADIDEASLTGIPGAGGGGGETPTGPPSGVEVIDITDDTDIVVGGVEVDLLCIADQTVAFVDSSVDDSRVFFELSGASSVFDADFDSTDDVLTASSGDGAGTFSLFFGNGATNEVASVELAWDTDADCSNVEVIGQAID